MKSRTRFGRILLLAILVVPFTARPAAAQSSPGVGLPAATPLSLVQSPFEFTLKPPSPTQAISPLSALIPAESHVISSNGSTVYINSVVNATAAYAAGYTGTRAIVMNLEAGHVWNGHESLDHTALFLTGSGALGDYDRHATWAGQTLGGLGSGFTHQVGIAPGATLWSGAIATSWNSQGVGNYSSSFNITSDSALSVYADAMVAGRNGNLGGATADVINSSWGGGAGSTGINDVARGIDGLIYATGKAVVFSAGNNGPNANTVGSPAAGYNTISVAALGSDTSNPVYNTVSSFSSRGPTGTQVPDNINGSSYGSVLAGTRVRVDIAAPGQNLTLAYYGGDQGGNAFEGGVNNATNLYSTNNAGTSFAAPAVAGGLGLMVDAAKERGFTTTGVDARVLKAVLLNGADKTSGWNNGQSTISGVIVTTQALDTTVGAGRMNVGNSIAYYTNASATRDVAGTGTGDLGSVRYTGWDYGVVNQGERNSYQLDHPVAGGSTMTATLTWFANRGINTTTLGSLTENKLADLDLEVWSLDETGTTLVERIAVSESTYNNTEHLSFTVPSTGRYGIAVHYSGDNWDFINSTTEIYAVAWSTVPVPEPAMVLSLAAVALVVGAGLRRRRLA